MLVNEIVAGFTGHRMPVGTEKAKSPKWGRTKAGQAADAWPMSSITTVHGTTTTAPVASPKPTEASKPAGAPASPANAGPAATLQLSQKALAKLKGDKDWQPGQTIDAI